MKILYRNTKSGLLYFSSIFLILILFLTILFLFRNIALKEQVLSTEKSELKVYSMAIDDKIVSVASSVLLLENIVLNDNAFVVNGTSTSFVDEASKTAVVDNMYDWMVNNKFFDQIRILDMSGQEIVRLNCSDICPVVVADQDLQNKADRYYFQNAINLDDDAVYLSEIDLNIENGEIEYVDGNPVPMLRLASPMYNENNEQIGLLIVNYLADNLFHNNGESTIATHAFEVINEDGYYIHALSPDIEFGFMFDDTTQVFSTFHDFDMELFNQDGLYQSVYKNHVYTSILIDQEYITSAIQESVGSNISVHMENEYYVAFGYLNYFENKQFISLYETMLWLILPAFLVSVLVSRLIDEIFYIRKENLKMLQFTATHDLLTGLPNRSEITHMIDYYNSRNRPFSLLFLDLDKFKAVNDTFGHDIGDLVLIESAKRFKKSVRETDTVARLGGDEFLILLDELVDEKVISRITKKIKTNIKMAMSFENITCTIGVSIGYAVQDKNITGQDIINQADKKMYADKHNEK